jgi:FKBP-type peptidyl-prolyl cis-trans isomerase
MRSILIGVGALALTLAACDAGGAGGDVSLKTDMDSVSYAYGLGLGLQSRSDSVFLNPDAVAAGMRDASDTTKARLTGAQAEDVMNRFRQKLMAQQQERMQEKMKQDSIQAIENLANGTKELEENKKREGVQTTPSGLQYRVLEEGDGPTPSLTDTVVVHYKGELIDGKVFDSSYDRGEPATFTLDAVIPGWKEALQKMKVGSKWELLIPPGLAYGAQPAGEIPGNSTLRFEVQLLSIKGKE